MSLVRVVTCNAVLPGGGQVITPPLPMHTITFPCDLPPIQELQLGGSYDLRVGAQIGGLLIRGERAIQYIISVRTRPVALRAIFTVVSSVSECVRTAIVNERVGMLDITVANPTQCDIAVVGFSRNISVNWQLPSNSGLRSGPRMLTQPPLGVRYTLNIMETYNGTNVTATVTSATVIVNREAVISADIESIQENPVAIEDIEEEPIQTNLQLSRTPNRKKTKITSCKPTRKALRCNFGDMITQSEMTIPMDSESIPNINIEASTIRDQTDIGLLILTVRDIISYECFYSPPSKKDECRECPERIVNRSEVIETVFERFIDYNRVLEGDGCSLLDKVRDIIIRNDIQVDVTELFLRIVLYGALVYFLSRLMYGFFDVRFLLRRFSKRFFRDLRNSRFCLFLNAFKSPELRGIGCLFKYDLHHRENRNKDDQDFIFKEINCDDNVPKHKSANRIEKGKELSSRNEKRKHHKS